MSTTTALPTDEQLDRLTGDFPFYSGTCLKIRPKSGAIQPFYLNTAQRVVEAKVIQQREETGRIRAIVLKARQKGISTYIAGRFFQSAHLWPGMLAMVIADVRKRSDALFEIYDRFRLNLPLELAPRVLAHGKHLRFGHDSKIEVDTARDVDAGRTLTIQRLHASEVAFWDTPEETMLSLLQAVPADGSEVFLESTANGVGNYFHRAWERAEAGENGYIAIFLPWWIHEEYRVELTPAELQEILATKDPWERQALDQGIEWEPPGLGIDPVLESGASWDGRRKRWRLAPEQLAWRRRTIRDETGGDERKFRQEYPSTAREAFLVSGNCFFDEEKLLEYEKKQTLAPERGNLVPVGPTGFVFRPAENGYLQVWERPDPKRHYVIGADTAEGRQVAARATSFDDPGAEFGDRDFSCARVVRVGYWRTEPIPGKKTRKKIYEPPEVVAEYHARVAPDVFAQAIHFLGNWYSCPGAGTRQAALVGVERNHSSGQTTLSRLRDIHRYQNLYFHRLMNKRSDKPTEYLGWVTNAETRMPMLDELARVVREGLWGDRCPGSIREMFTFVRNEEGRPQAQEGCHDDRVMAGGIALQMERQHFCAPPTELPEEEIPDSPTGL